RGLRSPLDLSTPRAAGGRGDVEPRVARTTPRRPEAQAFATAPAPAAPTVDAPAAPAAGATTDAPLASASAAPAPAPAPAPADLPTSVSAGPSAATSFAGAAAPSEAPAAPSAEPAARPSAVAPASAAVDTAGLPPWALGLDAVALAPARLLGRPKQTALILDRDLSTRADALVAATGPRVTFAAVVTAILHFHLPADGEAAARTIGAYRRRKLEALDHPWEERNARLPEPLRGELDEVVAGATGRVASVHRSTLVNALLDAHLPATADEASRLVTRMEMVRGGAFLEHAV
ncbi:hypothetical protein AB0L40_07495, partial [Patulibacter sp. NPDC049589]